MNRYMMIRRLRGPAFLLLVGVLALLAETHIISWMKSWPLFLILAGVLMLAERAALSAEMGHPPDSGQPNPWADTGLAPYPGQPTAFIPGQSRDYEQDPFERKS